MTSIVYLQHTPGVQFFRLRVHIGCWAGRWGDSCENNSGVQQVTDEQINIIVSQTQMQGDKSMLFGFLSTRACGPEYLWLTLLISTVENVRMKLYFKHPIHIKERNVTDFQENYLNPVCMQNKDVVIRQKARDIFTNIKGA